jgi:glycosyltransferase involved in cell wall biosynthesis
VTSGDDDPPAAPHLRVTFVTEGDPDRMSGGSLYHRRLRDLATGEGATVRFVSVPTRRFPLAVVDGRSVLRDAAADADVVVVDSLASNTLGPWLAARHRQLPPLVGSVHQALGGSDAGPVRRRSTSLADRLAWRACQVLVVPSALLADGLRDAGVRHPALRVVPPGHELPPATSGRGCRDLRAGRRLAVLCVANWLPRKGILSLLDAVAALPDDAVTVHLVGDEHVDRRHRNEILARLARADVGPRCVRHGVVARDHIAALYDAADVFVMPSTEEPYGIVYGEAMALGLPVIGWNVGNLPNLVDDGVEGLLVAPGDTAALTDAIGTLADDDTLVKHMAVAAFERAGRLPTWHDTAHQFFAACREALRRSTSPGS